jgi:hypothetical protein
MGNKSGHTYQHLPASHVNVGFPESQRIHVRTGRPRDELRAEQRKGRKIYIFKKDRSNAIARLQSDSHSYHREDNIRSSHRAGQLVTFTLHMDIGTKKKWQNKSTEQVQISGVPRKFSEDRGQRAASKERTHLFRVSHNTYVGNACHSKRRKGDTSR